MDSIRLTKYSHGAGCGCKISPSVLDRILSGKTTHEGFTKLLVGNGSRDDAAVYDLGNGKALISTTDFFMPIVDDPYSFGKIAAANAISDIYAMGGKPILAIAILGWPINTLSPELAGKVVSGGEMLCHEAGIPLAGGHSIDCPEPIFGLSVNGLVDITSLKRNDTARAGDLLFLTKSIGVGILTTAEKRGLLKEEHIGIAAKQMMRLNRVGSHLSEVVDIHAMTDVTGFGLLGHLSEMAEGSGLSAELFYESVPIISSGLGGYVSVGAVPGGTERNWSSYGHRVSLRKGPDSYMEKALLADPQTSGGLLLSVGAAGVDHLKSIMLSHGLSDHMKPIGRMIPRSDSLIYVR